MMLLLLIFAIFLKVNSDPFAYNLIKNQNSYSISNLPQILEKLTNQNKDSWNEKKNVAISGFRNLINNLMSREESRQFSDVLKSVQKQLLEKDSKGNKDKCIACKVFFELIQQIINIEGVLIIFNFISIHN